MAGITVYALGALLLFFTARSIYRLCFHPLSKIPGPKLAAITGAYEFYFNVIKQGTFIWELERLHQVYGPIIRITPNEVHIKDPDFYDDIYASSARRRQKDPTRVGQFDLDGSAFSSISPEAHRQRRAPLDKFFSKQAIGKMEHMVYESLDKLLRHLEDAYKSHKVVNLDAGFSGLTADVIHKYVYGINSGNLDHEDFNENVRDGIMAMFRSAHVLYFFPILQTVMNSVPLWLLKKINPFAFALVQQKAGLHSLGVEALYRNEKGVTGSAIIDTIASPVMPADLRKPTRMMNEGFALIIGGTETTARALAMGAFHIFSNENIRMKLREELKTVMPSPDSRPTSNQLEQLPYLSGVVNETLRIATGISARSPRVAPTEALVYKDYVIPPGTLMSETHYFILTDPNIFPNPHVFDPERWMRAAAKGERLDKYQVVFSKGSRACVGMNLAYAELFLLLAHLTRRFDIGLYETTKEDIALVRDFGTPYPDKGNFFVRALVKGVVQE